MSGAELRLPAALGELAALRLGTPGAAPVLALHGWLDNAASFVPIAPCLRGPLDLVALDLPGHGRSARLGPGAEYSPWVALTAILDAADALGWERFALLGHSMGAGLASLLAVACPQRVARVVCIEALGGLGEDPGEAPARLRKAMEAARAPSRRGPRVFPDLDVPVRARIHANQLSEASARLLVERGTVAVEGGWQWSTDPRLILPALYRASHAQVDAIVAALACPALVVLADPAQPYWPEPLRSARSARLPHGRRVVLPGHHHLHMDRPETVAAAIGDFLLADGEGPD
ncbi:MAG: alpha/beta hydrolase [Pseudoxanthomonas sp.]